MMICVYLCDRYRLTSDAWDQIEKITRSAIACTVSIPQFERLDSVQNVIDITASYEPVILGDLPKHYFFQGRPIYLEEEIVGEQIIIKRKVSK